MSTPCRGTSSRHRSRCLICSIIFFPIVAGGIGLYAVEGFPTGWMSGMYTFILPWLFFYIYCLQGKSKLSLLVFIICLPLFAWIWWDVRRGLEFGELEQQRVALRDDKRELEVRTVEMRHAIEGLQDAKGMARQAIILYSEGIAKTQRGHYDDAVGDFTKAIRLSPDYAEVFGQRGYAHAKLGDFGNAIEDSKHAVQLGQESGLNWYQFARVLALAKKKDEMLEKLRKAVELDAEYKRIAEEDKDFRDYWDDPKFKELTKP